MGSENIRATHVSRTHELNPAWQGDVLINLFHYRPFPFFSLYLRTIDGGIKACLSVTSAMSPTSLYEVSLIERKVDPHQVLARELQYWYLR